MTKLIDNETGEVVGQSKENGLILANEQFKLEPTGLKVVGDPTFEAWELVGQQLHYIEGAVHWWIGDWLNYGERCWGEMYSQALDETGFDYETVRGDKWVSDRVEIVRRRTNLSHSHHKEVASLLPNEQDYWLDRAEKESLTRNEFRQEIRKWKAQKLLPSPDGSGQKSPKLIIAPADNTGLLSESVDLIITSPPYNLGDDAWPMGGDGRQKRDSGIGYQDEISEEDYQLWQTAVLIELYRVAKQGASLFYNHKVRIKNGQSVHPMQWLGKSDNPWIVRQEIIWDRGSTHNHSPSLFWPEDERIYWLTKGKPTLPDRPIGKSTIWREFGPVPNTWHPAPFCEELPRMCIEAVGRDGIIVLDPFAGSCTTLKVALEYGYGAIGIDISQEYLDRARQENGWMTISAT